LEKPTHAIIVLSQLDTRYFKEIAGIASWTLEFALVKRGEKDPLSEATPTLLYSRSVNLEIDLEAGEYVVYVSTRSYIISVRVLRPFSSPGPFRSHDLQGTGKIPSSHLISETYITTTGLLQEGSRQRLGPPQTVQDID
jgi:hypothetical protein